MPLFEVDGWDLKAKVVVGGPTGKKRSKRQERRDHELKKAEQEEAGYIARKAEREKAQEAKETVIEVGSSDKPEKTEGPSKKKKKNNKNKVDKSKDEKSKDVESEKSEEIAPTKTEEVVVEPTPVRTLPVAKLTPLQQKMLSKLSGSRFRWINEQLYTISSEEALSLIKKQPALFEEYHLGFRSQVQTWPQNPVDVFVETIRQRGTTKQVNAPGGLPGLGKQIVIADMGCGEAQLALDVRNIVTKFNKNPPTSRNAPKHLDIKVHSFDLSKHNERITVADIKNVPLPDNSCTVVIFCLALMGTNFLDFIKEANRILAPRGELWIAEIKSRFTESANSKKLQPNEVGAEFVDALKLSGFFHKKTDNENKMFTRFEFFKPAKEVLTGDHDRLLKKKKFIGNETELEELEKKRDDKPEGEWLLKPCIYKRR